MSFVTTNSADAKKGEDASPPASVIFDDGAFDSIQSDMLDADDDGVPDPYCHDTKAKIEVTITQDGHLTFKTSTQFGRGRTGYVDFDGPIGFLDPKDVPQTIETTDDLAELGIEHKLNISLGAWQENFNLNMMQEGETRHDVNFDMSIQLNEETAALATITQNHFVGQEPIAHRLTKFGFTLMAP